MANIQDILKSYNMEEEPIMSEMAPQDMQSPVTSDMMYRIPQASDIPAIQQQPQTPIVAQAEAPQPQAPETPKKPESELDRLERMLQEARRSDRALKVGGAIGDALATVINARSQMNVKAPGVQVQQGAGLGKVADMFATAPEIRSDIAARREAMLRQYSELARGERAKLDRDLKERQISAYEAQTRAQARKAEREAGKEATKEAQPSFEEKERIKANVKEEFQVAKENRQIKEKLESAIPTVDEQIKNVKTALNLINKSEFAGTGPLDQYFAGVTPEGQLLKKALRNIQLDTLVTKFQGMSRAVDTETDRKFFQETQPDMGNFETTNKKMLVDILERLEGIKERSQNKLKEITSQKEASSQPVEARQQKATNLVKIKGPSGQEATMTEEKAQKYLSKPGYTRIE